MAVQQVPIRVVCRSLHGLASLSNCKYRGPLGGTVSFRSQRGVRYHIFDLAKYS